MTAGGLSDSRKGVVDRAYAKLDADGNGIVKMDDVRAVYCADRHPKVLSGEWTVDKVFANFMEAFGDKDGT